MAFILIYLRFLKKTLTEGFWVVVVVVSFCTNGYFFVCVYMCARAFVYSFFMFLVTAGQGGNLQMQIVS